MAIRTQDRDGRIASRQYRGQEGGVNPLPCVALYASSLRSSSGAVTGSWQAPRTQTYAVGFPC